MRVEGGQKKTACKNHRRHSVGTFPDAKKNLPKNQQNAEYLQRKKEKPVPRNPSRQAVQKRQKETSRKQHLDIMCFRDSGKSAGRKRLYQRIVIEFQIEGQIHLK